MKKEVLVKKYLKALTELHQEIVVNDNNSLRMTEFARLHKLSSFFPSIIIKNGLVLNTGSKKYPKYVWGSDVIPNIKTAEKFVDELQKNNKTLATKYPANLPPVPLKLLEEHNHQTPVELLANTYFNLDTSNKESEAIIYLKTLGYKIMKPITEWEEV
jgi:hypothetical protein